MTAVRGRLLLFNFLVRNNLAFILVFFALTIATSYFGIAYPLGPGQDAHYHFYNAVVASKLWTGDSFYRGLYETMNPLESNTLLYTFLFPFELLLSPLRAWGVGFTLWYWVGFPVACLITLQLLRRPLWGALLAFPLAYTVKSFSQGGYLPFVSAAPLMVLSLGIFHRILEKPSSKRMYAACIATTSLCFMAHAHVYSWLMVLLASATIMVIIGLLFRRIVTSPAEAVRAAFATGSRALFLVLPSLVLFSAWWYRTHHGAHADGSWGLRATFTPIHARIPGMYGHFIHVRGDREFSFLLPLALVIFTCLSLGRSWRKAGAPTAELAIILTFVSWCVLPTDVSGQMVADRHMDLTTWLLPLALYSGEARTGAIRHSICVAAIVGFSWIRLMFLGDSMRLLQKDYEGMLSIAKDACPKVRGELAYVTSTEVNAQWYGKGLHQAHETFAALCLLDTPIYDRVYPHNLVPLRYRYDLPAPITIRVGVPSGWWTHPAMAKFDYVLVQGWSPSQSELASAPPSWSLAARNGGWSLWRKSL